MLKNTAIVAIFIAAGQLITSSMAGFALSYLQFRGRDALFQLFMVAIMIPYHVLLVPMFTMLRDMKLLGSLWSLILPGLVSPFGVFLMRQSFMTIPRALAEAARSLMGVLLGHLLSDLCPLYTSDDHSGHFCVCRHVE